jgi:hypothetical protein
MTDFRARGHLAPRLPQGRKSDCTDLWTGNRLVACLGLPEQREIVHLYDGNSLAISRPGCVIQKSFMFSGNDRVHEKALPYTFDKLCTLVVPGRPGNGVRFERSAGVRRTARCSAGPAVGQTRIVDGSRCEEEGADVRF